MRKDRDRDRTEFSAIQELKFSRGSMPPDPLA